MRSDYYINRKGEHVMTYPVFKAMPFDRVCRMLGINNEVFKQPKKKEKK